MAAAIEPLMINIVPVYENHVDFTVSEIRRQAREVGLKRFALSFSFHPAGTPAWARVPGMVALFHRIREGIADPSIELGVLVQSTMGHGWNGKVPLTREPWQKIVLLDGTESPRMCPLDPGFSDYVFDCVSAVVRERASFLIVDDDFGFRDRECFCPLHVAAYNEALGKDYTAEDYRRIIAERPWDDPEVATVSRLRLDTVLPLARRIREAIDAVDPSVRCGFCTVYDGHGYVEEIALALAGGTRPFVRVNNAVYGMVPSLHFPYIVSGTHRVRYQMPAVEEVLDEADTFPQNYYSESAAAFHTHVTLAFLDGLRGCKLWASEFNNPVDTGSQGDYERRLRDYMPFYRKLLESVDGIRWKGVSEMLYRPKTRLHPSLCSQCLPTEDWNTELIGRFGFPVRYEAPSAEGVYAISILEADQMSDEEIRLLLSGAFLVDSFAAKALTKRGFAPLLGVEATDGDDDFVFSDDLDEETGLFTGMMKEGRHALLKPVADGVEVVTRFTQGGARTRSFRRVAPSMTFFRNELGGRVVVTGWSPCMSFYATTRPQRRQTLQRALDFLEGGPFEMGVETGRQFLVRHGVMKDGSELVALVNLSYDPFEALPIRLVREPASVERLLPSGEWAPLGWKRTDREHVSLEARAVICDPLVCRFRFRES